VNVEEEDVDKTKVLTVPHFLVDGLYPSSEILNHEPDPTSEAADETLDM
jgi:hypothetical protein